ncbi:22973_t:CDS:2, partial [Gigaspora margarita]
TNDFNTSQTNDPNTPETNNYSAPRTNQRILVNVIIGETDMVGEDDDYNVDEGRPWKNLSRENLEWEEEKDFNEYENPGQRQEKQNQN